MPWALAQSRASAEPWPFDAALAAFRAGAPRTGPASTTRMSSAPHCCTTRSRTNPGALAPGGRDAALAALAGQFGPRVAALVEAVTNPEWEPGADRHAQYRAHVAESLAANPWARVIKASDFTDNGVGLIRTSGPRAARLARKYAPLIPVLADLIARPDTPLSPQAKARILGQLVTAQERLAAITAAASGSTGGHTAAPE
jgi:hypothetical protein